MPPWFKRVLQCFADPLVEEVLVSNNGRMVLTDRAGRSRSEGSPFNQEEDMGLALQEFAFARGLRLDHLCPAAGGITEDGSLRWHSLLPPAAIDGPVLVLRRHRFDEIGVANFRLSNEQARLLSEVMTKRHALLIAGATGSGKTSLLAALLREYARDERVVIIEELAELPLLADTWLRLLAKEAHVDGRGQITVARLLKDSLRLRPDRLVLGELQAGHLLPFVESIWAGHGGSCATFHGGSLAAVRRRFLALLRSEGYSESLEECPLWAVVMQRGDPPQVGEIAQLFGE